MGDRGNIVVEQEKGRIYLYTHWRGSKIGSVLQVALRKRWRWDDEAYLTRIIFCELINGSERDETGFGIAVEPPDNSHPFLIVDCRSRTVRRETPKGLKLKVWGFEEFCDEPKPDWEPEE